MTDQFTRETAVQWHVVSLIVQGQPSKIQSIKTALMAMPNTEVPALDMDKGKLVVVMESADQHELIDRVEALKEIDGVIVVSLVYHEQDQ